ncbi:uncharacterized protein [Amphiura filiformis]|uniref:uncharacterized protein n=1 Tax=Amphiura filiformis TaxID=82378 RepID=UPI003B21A301
MSGQASIREADVSCPVCKEIFNSRQNVPKMLPCSHTVCTPCLQQLQSGSRIKCPICSIEHYTTVGVLQTNLTAQNIGDKYVPESQSSTTSSWYGVFQISVKTLEDATILLDVRSSTTINEIKNMIQTKAGLTPSYQRLMFMGRPLMDGAKSLSGYGISKDSNLHLFKRMLGGFHLDN